MAAKKTLFAYVSGTEHSDAVVKAVETKLDALVAERKWTSKDVWVVNQKEPPYWDLGVNVAVPTGKALSPAFLDDAVAIADALASIHDEVKRSFVIGIADGDATADLLFIDSAKPEVERLKTELRRALKMADPI